MSFLLPRGITWTPANWVSRGFFDDAVHHLTEAPHLADDVRFSVDAEVDTIDLRMATTEVLQELQVLVQRVLAENLERQGSNFYQSEYFPIYLQHLQSLNEMVGDALLKPG